MSTTIETNPLLQDYATPFGTPPFAKIKTSHYEPAFVEGIKKLKSEINDIAESDEQPTFENTVAALERSGRLLSKVSSAFFNVLNAEADDEMMEVSQAVSPMLSESENDIYLNEKLFKRIKQVYESTDLNNLDVEDSKLLEETYDAFVAKGANLSGDDKDVYRKLTSELAQLSLTFDQNILKDKGRYELLLTEDDEIKGLPKSILEAAALRAKEKGKDGYLFTLSAPSYIPFMKYAANRQLREKMYRDYLKVGNKGDEFDNNNIIKRIANIRLEIARLFGYNDYAEYKLKHTMAAKKENVYKLLSDLKDAYRPVGEKEVKAVEELAAITDGEDFRVMPWDWSYYSEKLKDSKFNVNDEMTRPYFELENVKCGVFGLATTLYGITFKKNSDIEVYHPEVETYEVYDKDDSLLAILYTDFFPREGKQSGAWMNGIKEQYIDENGKNSRPQIIIVMNFSRPTESEPSLLTFDEVNTFLHEFGHALHGMFANTKYASLSGTNVYRDFVELPSQIMENWLTEKEFLDKIASHYKTGEPIPAELVKNLVDASNFNAGYACCRQLSFGLLDMAWHTIEKPVSGDAEQFEKTAWSEVQLLPEVKGTLMSANFSHIFSGGYAAGYYGYKWAEVLDADAFSVFKEKGIFNREVAERFRYNLLAKGGTENPDKLYKDFKGSAPTIDALLKRNGIK